MDNRGVSLFASATALSLGRVQYKQLEIQLFLDLRLGTLLNKSHLFIYNCTGRLCALNILIFEETLITLVYHWDPGLVSARPGPRMGPELPVLSRQDLGGPLSPCCIQYYEWQSTYPALKDRGRLREKPLTATFLSVLHLEARRQLTSLPVLVPQDSPPILL